MRNFTKLMLTLAFAIVGVGSANASYSIGIGTRYTSVAELSGKVFAIADESVNKALYGPKGGYGHEVGFDAYSTAWTNDVNFYYFKLVDIPADKIAEDPTLEGWTLIRACKADGTFYTFWGDPNNGYLNTQPELGVSFLLGITAKNLGQDANFGAVWKVEYDGTNGGFTLKNKCTDKYLKDAGSAHNDEPAYFTFCTVESVEVFDPDTEDPGVAAIPSGNISLISNGTLEGDDVSSFFTKVNKGAPNPSVITNGVGRYNGRGITITSMDNAAYGWDTQFWVKFNRNLPTGTPIHIEFNYRSSEATTVSSQEHSLTCGYVFWSGLAGFSPSINWKNFSQDFTITKGDESALINVGSIAFNLNDTKDKAIDFYFDNFLVYAEARDVNIKSAGWGTFGFDKAVSFGDDVEAYTATYNSILGYVTLNPVTTLAANKGVIIKAPEGDYKALVNDGTGVVASDNELLVSDGSITGDGSTIYALGKKDAKVGFIKVKSGVTIPTGKAYLVITGIEARDFIGFGEEDVTSIESVEQATKVDNQYFNLAGQRVAQPTKGLYIVNGKKVVIK